MQVLNCGQNMQLWAPDPATTARTYRDLIVRDKDIVKMVLLLTGSIEGENPSASGLVRKSRQSGLH